MALASFRLGIGRSAPSSSLAPRGALGQSRKGGPAGTLVPAGPPDQKLTGYQVWPASVVQSIWPRLPVPGFPVTRQPVPGLMNWSELSVAPPLVPWIANVVQACPLLAER